MALFYEAWRELDRFEKDHGISPLTLPDHCDHLDGKRCSMWKPCPFCAMARKYGRPPSDDPVRVERR